MPVELAVNPGVPQSTAEEITISPAAAQPDFDPGRRCGAQSGLYEPGLATEHLIQGLIISGS
jgi:hypothetical protein